MGARAVNPHRHLMQGIAMTLHTRSLRPLVAAAALAFTLPLWASDARPEAPRQPTPHAPSAEQLRANALKRCDVHKGLEERALCVRMVSGDGQVSGSVSGGGLLRELETPIPNPTQ
jgi:hypothetical protein